MSTKFLMTEDATATLQRAVAMATHGKYKEVTPEHFLKAVLDNPHVVQLLKDLEIDDTKLREQLDAQIKTYTRLMTSMPNFVPPLNTTLDTMLVSARSVSKSDMREQMTIGYIFASFWTAKMSKALYYMQEAGLERNKCIGWFTTHNEMGPLPQEAEKPQAAELEHADGPRQQDQRGKSPLAEFGIDMTKLAKEGKLWPMYGRETELARVAQILSRKSKNNPVLIGEAGVGKTAIAEGLAINIHNKTAPAAFHDFRVISISLADMVAGAIYRGEFEQRLTVLIQEVKKDGKIILFIDELHTVVGAGGSGAQDASNILKTALARGELRLIGATTRAEYRRYIEKNKPLARRFQPVQVEEPSVEDMKKIMPLIAEDHGKWHDLSFEPAALQATIDLAKRYISSRAFPDKAVDVVDEAASAVKLRRQAGDKGRLIVRVADIEQAVATMAKLPRQSVNADEEAMLASLAGDLKNDVFDQDEAIDQIVELIQMHRFGLMSYERPICSVLSLGGTGTGKTKTGQSLAKRLGIPLVRFDMAAFSERHQAAGLVGAPAGFVGYEDGAKLSDAIDANPHCVLMLDEIEKAHESIFDKLLSVMDYGRLDDAQGRPIDFRNVIIIMTSNIGAVESERGALGFGKSAEDTSSQAIDEAVKRVFKPEFIARLDGILKYKKLTRKTSSSIIDTLLEDVKTRLKEKNIDIEVTESARQKLVEIGFDPTLGARPTDRMLRDKVKKPLMRLALGGAFKNGGIARIDVANDEIMVVAA